MKRSLRVPCGLAWTAGALVLLAAVVPALGAGGNTANLFLPGDGLPTWRVHPDTFDGLDLAGSHFTMFTDPGGLVGDNFTHLAALDVTSAFSTGNLKGVLWSQIWQSDVDSHLLFAYKLENTGGVGFADMQIGNIEGYDKPIGVVDAGILQPGGDGSYGVGDVLEIGRTTDGVSAQLFFSFKSIDSSYSTLIARVLEPGQQSSWFYADTDQDAWHLGAATIQNGGISRDQIPVLVPGADTGTGVIPEPLTALAVLAGAGSLSGYIRRRRT